jgi:CBS domain-containing protein
MRVRDIMTTSVECVSPDDTVHDAARKMTEEDCGALPVTENDQLVGMITDRDIVTRAVAKGYDPDECYVREIMSTDVKYVRDDETTDTLAHTMSDLQVKRMPVVNKDHRIVGIVALCDVGQNSSTEASVALDGLSKPNSAAIHAHI